MELFVPKETFAGENRAALIPVSVKKLVEAGLAVKVEAGLGLASDYEDKDYEEAGASIVEDRAQALGSADLVMRVRKPSEEEIGQLKSGVIHISFLRSISGKRPPADICQGRGERHQHGNDAPHHPGPENGCALLPGQFGRVLRRHQGGRADE